MIAWLFGDLIYWLTLLAFVVGIVAFVASFLVGFLPMLKAHAMILKYGGMALIVGSVYFLGDRNGYQRRVDEDKAEIERLNGEARAKEEELKVSLTKATNQLRKAKNDIKVKQASIDSRVDSGELRLPSTCGVQASSSPSSTARDSTNESDTERQTIKALVGIAADGDSAIVSLNSCIAQYETVMKTVNEGVK
jgi:hypothetical protein